ncbi:MULTISPECIES: AfsR/SARP family transcriptional regulator [unclassified Pseudofrankia]|uniref:AfsR/SARP family transcriptional regulator n=1 Tax=unclassified Pseudofrankia TaxID=2994372 RepID=UPI0008DA1422|nr:MULTISPECIES: AfsR/SARP family transcriptional regulator [unclassified Pseudofrankia]MDT3440010.1 AfsR/SARP family transcriptional regulator [Pseudofrankia sp. BMG5.37]OHV56755.1 hypothetical protein BCD48_43570 [Pseudofrankia sp. BMG5.36]
MRYEILGPVRVLDGETVQSITASKLAILLGVLLIRGGQLVTSDLLITEIWGHEPPRRAHATLHVYVSQLRKILRRESSSINPIATRPIGYVLQRHPDDLDTDVFRRHIETGRSLASDGAYAAAVASFDAALALWRGPVLDEVGEGPLVTGFRASCGDLFLEGLEKRTDALLALGGHRELVGRLFRLVAEYPLWEAFYRQLMVALYRSERRAEALGVYRSAREVMGRELGLEPSRTLTDLQQAILTSDRSLDVDRWAV